MTRFCSSAEGCLVAGRGGGGGGDGCDPGGPGDPSGLDGPNDDEAGGCCWSSV